MSGEMLWWLNLLVGVGIFTLLAVSLNLINGYAGMFHLGHHGFWALGAYAAAWIVLRYEGALPGPLLYALSLLLSMAVAAVGGLVIGIPCLRLRGDYLAIATLGFGEIIRIAIQNTPESFLGGSLGLFVPRVLMRVTRETKDDFRLLTFAIVALLVALSILLIARFIRSAQGRRLLAVAQDETAAGLLGIDPTHSKVTAFVFGAAIAGLAGGLFAHYEGKITPLDFNFMEMVKMFLIVVLGGMGSLSGCVVGALLVVGTERLLSRAPGFLSEWWQVEFPLLLALLIIYRPPGDLRAARADRPPPEEGARMSEPLFRTEGLTKRYGGLTAVCGVCIELHAGELVGLIGPNGAGKTTCFNLITGADTPTEGCIRLQGKEVRCTREFEMARRGVARTFQNIRLWKEMTVLDNVRTVCKVGARYGALAALLRLPRYRRIEAEVTAKSMSLLERMGLSGVGGERAADLPYGDQRKLEIARALATDPKILLLDEPAAGMNPSEKIDLMHTVREIRGEFDLTVLLIEHDMKFVMGICERIYRPRPRRGDRPRHAGRDPAASRGHRRLPRGGGVMLRLEGIDVFYGSVQALHALTLEVREGEIVTLIGANGAGKSTTLRTISGLLRPARGALRFGERDLARLPSHEVVAAGISHVPEGRRIFTGLTVRENLDMGAYLVRDAATAAHRLERVFSLFPRLKERMNQSGGTLSGGEQQMLAIGRALMSGPRLLLLDEPSLGIAPILVQEIFEEIRRINREDGTTILLVEQNANMALKLAHRGYVLETGRIVLEDEAEALLVNPQVREAYLG
ncbi:MAG: ATP-binding cassette domain-containing protein [Planctomycetes bacterium]|nr:ATP-binding cassette domain-containing protein [Planctomycetota bacterium]